MFKRAATEHQKDESRRKNVIIYKSVEKQEPNLEERQRTDHTMVDQLLTHLGVFHEPIKVTRLGKYEPENTTKVRPIKVEFESNEAQEEIMSKAYKLASAPENLKKISVSYDMTKTEQEQCKILVQQAKDD